MFDYRKEIIIAAGDIDAKYAEIYNENIISSSVLFGDDYMNDCYKSLWLDCNERVYHGYTWENEENIKHYNRIIKLIKENLPARTERVLVDVSW